MVLRPLLLSLLSAWALVAQVRPALLEVKTVYLLPMSNGLDQYMASRLTKMGPFEVTTDPQLADAIFTDRLGMAFEQRWKELYPPPPPPVEPVKADDNAKAKDASEKIDELPDMSSAPVTRISSFARGKGNVFLVSRKSGSVVWSDFKSPKDSRSTTMNKTAERIVDQLRDDLNPKK